MWTERRERGQNAYSVVPSWDSEAGKLNELSSNTHTQRSDTLEQINTTSEAAVTSRRRCGVLRSQ